MPKIGKIVSTPDGVGKVTGYNVLKETVQVELESGTVIEVPLAKIKLQSQSEGDERESRKKA
jgi:cell fate regulator YaaT (PSP1 superfamily)